MIITIPEYVDFVNERALVGHVYYYENSGYSARLSSSPKTKILRNARDDTFSVFIPNRLEATGTPSYNPNKVMPYLNIDNKYEFRGRNVDVPGMWDESGKQWKFYHSTIGNTKLRDLKVIAFGQDFSSTEDISHQETISPAFKWISNPLFDPIRKTASATFDDLVEFQTIKEIDFQPTPSFMPTLEKVSSTPDGGKWYTQSPTGFSGGTMTRFTHLIIKPLDINQFGINEDVAEIYGYSDDNQPMSSGDYEIKDATMKSTSIKNGTFHLDYLPYNGARKVILVPFEDKNHRASLLGTLKVADQSYYDFQSQETKLGLAYNSNVGEQIPFNLKGNYTREIQLSLNDVFKDVKVSFSKTINQPTLGSSNGLVQLSVDNSEENSELPMKYFNADDIKAIKENNFDLVGLVRLAHEK